MPQTTSLEDYILSLTEDHLRNAFGSSTFYKGQSYFNDGRVLDSNIDREGDLVIKVQGNRNYQVVLQYDHKRGLYDDCTCPVGGSCKHVVAALLYLMNEDKSEIPKPPEEAEIKETLLKLSKSEMADLLLKHAPDYVLAEIVNKNQGRETGLKIVAATDKKIKKLLKDIPEYDNPCEFEASLVNEIRQLRGYWTTVHEEVFSIFMEIIEACTNNVAEGYLYDHYNDYTFEFIETGEELTLFLKSLPFELRMKHLNNIEEEYKQLEFNLDGLDFLLDRRKELFDETDRALLKKVILNDLEKGRPGMVRFFYENIEPLLCLDEKEKILGLSFLTDYVLCLKYLYLLKSANRYEEALTAAETFLSRMKPGIFGHDYHLQIHILEIKKHLQKNIDAEALSIIQEHALLDVIEQLVEIVPHLQPELEAILSVKRPEQFIDLLIKNKRTKEGLYFLDGSKFISNSKKFEFFKLYKNDFVQKASLFYESYINEELEYTGQSHYSIITDCLRELLPINYDLAHEIIAQIRQHYKRRTNLMELLRQIG